MKSISKDKVFYGRPLNYRDVNQTVIDQMGTIIEREDACKLILKKTLEKFDVSIQDIIKSVPNWETYDAFVVDGTHYTTALLAQKDCISKYKILTHNDFKNAKEMLNFQILCNKTTRTTLRNNILAMLSCKATLEDMQTIFGLNPLQANAITFCSKHEPFMQVIDGDVMDLNVFMDVANYCNASPSLDYAIGAINTLLEDATKLSYEQSVKWFTAFKLKDKAMQQLIKEQKKKESDLAAKIQADQDKHAFKVKVLEAINEGMPFIVLTGIKGKNGKSEVSVQADTILMEDKLKNGKKTVSMKNAIFTDIPIVKKPFEDRLYPKGVLFVNGYVVSNNPDDLAGILPNGEVVNFVLLENKDSIRNMVIENAIADIAVSKEKTIIQKNMDNAFALFNQQMVNEMPSITKLMLFNLVEGLMIPKTGSECVFTIRKANLKTLIEEDKIVSFEDLYKHEYFMLLMAYNTAFRVSNSLENSKLSMLSERVQQDMAQANVLEDGYFQEATYSKPMVLNSPGNYMANEDEEWIANMTDEERMEYYNDLEKKRVLLEIHEEELGQAMKDEDLMNEVNAKHNANAKHDRTV